MPWTPSVPEPTHAPADDVLNMQQNNDQIQTSFSVDHNPLASVSNDGYHKKISFSVPIPAPALVAPAASLYTNGSPAQLFYQNGAAVTPVQITGQNVLESGTTGGGGTYNVFQLPFGMRLFTGLTPSFNGSYSGTLSGAQTFGAALYVVSATPDASTATGVAFSVQAGLNTFTMKNAATTPVSWLALTN